MEDPPRDGADTPRALEYLFGYAQHLYPHHVLSRLMFGATRLRYAPLNNALARWFIRRFGVDMSLAVEADPARYPTFNALFTRALRPGVRAIAREEGAILSPADGTISQIGTVTEGRLLQAKGRYYTLERLLGGDPARAAPFDGGRFAAIYLAPHDYHRVHMPADGRLREMVHVPGRLFSVNRVTTRVVPSLFVRNERIACLFDSPEGPFAVVLVGAIFVGSMETVWHGLVRGAGRVTTWRYEGEAAPMLARGEEMGRFNMGSTVIVLVPAERAAWRAGLGPGDRVEMGQIIGHALARERRRAALALRSEKR